MSTYHITAPDGAEYEIDAKDDNAAQEAMSHLQAMHSSAPQQPNKIDEMVGNAPKDALENIKGLAAQATGPAMDIMSGDVASALPKLAQQGQQFMQHPIDNLKQMAEPMMHPINYAVQHPVSQAINVASLGLPMAEGALDTVGQYANRFGEDQAVKALGRTPPGMSSDAARALGRRAVDQYGLLDATEGPLGRKADVAAMKDQSGHEIGEIRDSAPTSMSASDLADAIRERLKEAYSEGGQHFEDVNALERQLQNISKMPSTSPSDIAQRATELNQNAKGKGFMLPHNVETDVAGVMSDINDDAISKALPDDAERYGQLNQTFGDMKDLGNIIERGEKRQLNQRGANTLFEAGHKFVEELGAHKVGAKLWMGVGDALEGIDLKTPSSAVLMSRVVNSPQSFGQYAQPLLKAIQDGGSQGFAATHFLLANQYPEYNDLVNGMGK